MAAAQTLPQDRIIHSLHAHFIRRGENAQPVEYRVERERDGGSYSTRLVHAYQGERRLLATTLSFSTSSESQADTPRDLGAIPDPTTLQKSSDWFSQFERRGLPAASQGQLSSSAWFLSSEPQSYTPNRAAAALAFMSDDLPTEAVMLAGADAATSIQQYFTASLDHSIWFHREIDPNDWLLMQFDCATRVADRGLAQGQVFNRQGVHVASISQEVLLRDKRKL